MAVVLNPSTPQPARKARSKHGAAPTTRTTSGRSAPDGVAPGPCASEVTRLDDADDGGLSAASACVASLGSLRVGEATNPGHGRLLNWVATCAASAVSYAAPGRTGFHGVHSPGFDAQDAPPKEPFTLRIITANTTGWRPLQRMLCRTDANVVFAQEHRLRPDDIPAASAWARKHGWKTVWAPAKEGSGGGASAGTVVCARSFYGATAPRPWRIHHQ